MTDSEFSKGLRLLLDARKIKVGELAEKMGISSSYVSQLLSGHRQPGIESLKKISEVLGLKLDDLVRGNVSPADAPSGRLVPVISWVQAGALHEPIDLLPYAGSAEQWVQSESRDANAFALRVEGDSMEPDFREGDVIVVDPNTEAQNGDFVVASFRGEVTFKKYRVADGLVMLKPLNPRHDDIVITSRDFAAFRVVGKVTELKRRL